MNIHSKLKIQNISFLSNFSERRRGKSIRISGAWYCSFPPSFFMPQPLDSVIVKADTLPVRIDSMTVEGDTAAIEKDSLLQLMDSLAKEMSKPTVVDSTMLQCYVIDSQTGDSIPYANALYQRLKIGASGDAEATLA